MPMVMSNRSRIIGTAIAGLVCASASAAPENITDGELALTPKYCQDVQGIRYGDAFFNKSPRADYWVGMMGKSFWALHHYCWALINLRRSQAAGVTAQVRRGLIENVVADCFYVIKNSTPDFILLPEIYTRIGDAEMMLSNPGAAYEAYTMSRKIKPDYWPPYARWAEVLVKINQKAEAKALLAEGLRNVPDAKPLIDQYRALGGDPKQIVPIVKAPKPDPQPAESGSPASSAASATSS